MRKLLFPLLLLQAGFLFSQDIYDLNHIPEIRMTFADAKWSQTLDSMKFNGTDDRLPATVTIDGKEYKEVGVRHKGNSSYKNPRSKGQKKLPFNLKADFILKDQRFPGGYTTLKLSNVFQDPSFLREVLSYEIARKYMPASRCNFVKIWVNDEYYGLYNNTQAVDEVMLDAYFDAEKGTFFKCDPEWEDVKDQNAGCPEGDKAALMFVGENPDCYKGWYELENGKKAAWQELIDLTNIITNKPEAIDKAMNVDAVLWMHAFNNVLVNLDSYTGRLSHNYYLYRTPDSLFTPIVWDMNISFGGFRFDGEKLGVLTDEEMQEFSMFVHYKNRNPKRPLITNLLTNPLYRKIYIGHCRTIVMENFANGEYLKKGLEIQKIIDDAVKNDPNKLYTYEGFLKNLHKTVDMGASESIGIEELMKKRTEILLAHPLFNGQNPIVTDVKHTVSGENVQITAKVKPCQKVYLSYRPSRTSPPIRVEMFDDGTHGDMASGDTVYGITIPKKTGTQYYIIAEGDRLAVCSPERAAFQYYEVK